VSLRILHNLSEERWALLKRTQSENDRLAIFVHGYDGTYLGTWGSLPKLLQERADQDLVLRDWDFLFMGYDHRTLFTFVDIADRIREEWERAEKDFRSVGRKYNKFALVGHSLGTLGIRQLLCASSLQPRDMFRKLHCVTLFGTPVSGSVLAWFSPWSIGRSLRPFSPSITMLHEWVKSSYEHNAAYAHDQWPPIKLVHGQADRVVRSRSRRMIQWPGDDVRHIEAASGHTDMTKPQTWDSTVVKLIRESCVCAP
jgi:pimeloyl-ACP methyl ester carboxylesterase